MIDKGSYLAKLARLLTVAGCVFAVVQCGGRRTLADTLLLGGDLIDGSGSDPVRADVAITGNDITFIGDASAAGIEAADSLDVSGLLVTPGFIDMHSHAELDEAFGRDGSAFLHQGITTIALGLDGGGPPEVAERLRSWAQEGIGVNALTFVGHGAVRRRVLGMQNRAPDPAELASMSDLVRTGMEEGAFGLSSGLFYTPGFYAETAEVIELAKVAAEFGGIYDTHDRDLGASYQGIGYLASIEEGIRIGEESGARAIFSHFNAQGAHNYGRAPEGAALIEAARARGVDVAAAQHVYTATQSSLRAYAVPRWAAAGGDTAMLRRFDHADTARILDRQTTEMLEIRGGAEKIRFVDPRPELNGFTLAEVAARMELPVPVAVRALLQDGNSSVMNLDLYDTENTRYLAQMPWMMTCTDGRTPAPGQAVSHPRVFGAFTRKLSLFVIDEPVIPLPFAIRSMSGLAADFLRLDDRGYLREGMKADVVVLDWDRVRDRATFDDSQQFSDGTVHVLVNGRFAIRDGEGTGALAGAPLVRPPQSN